MQVDLTTHAKIYAPEYGPHDFSDHLPMAIAALRSLGANDDRVNAFAATYAKRLRRRKVGEKTIDAALLSVRAGDPSVYPLALNFFLHALRVNGRAQVLADYLPELQSSIATAAFHGVIRTAYGLQTNENLEIAAGLAYWWSRSSSASHASSITAASNDAQSLIGDVAAVYKRDGKKLDLDQPTISARLTAVYAHPRIGAVLMRAARADVSFDDISAMALRIYLATEDFTALHCVTGVHATRIVAEHVVMNDLRLRKSLWGSICAAYAVIGAPELAALTPAPSGGASWQVIKAAAISSNDEHDIKFVYTCREEARKYGRDAQYRYAASRRLGLVDA